MNRMDPIRKALLGESSEKQAFTEEEKTKFHSNAISAITAALDEAEIAHSDDENEIFELFKEKFCGLERRKRTPLIDEAFIAVALDTPDGQNLMLSALNFELPDYLVPVIKAFTGTSCVRFPQKGNPEI